MVKSALPAGSGRLRIFAALLILAIVAAMVSVPVSAGESPPLGGSLAAQSSTPAMSGTKGNANPGLGKTCPPESRSGRPDEEIRQARRGCCSWHGGVCGCSNGRLVCCDNTFSPSCGC